MSPGRSAPLIALGAILICASIEEFAQSAHTTGASAKGPVTVPFVGCASDGQTGPTDSPLGKPHPVAIAPPLARQLAWYKAEDSPGVLAPRGWHCFGVYGSNGATLFVTPGPIDPKAPFSDDWKGFDGPAIQISFSAGDTSGRFEVAKVIARVFPAHMAFVREVIAEKIEPASEFPTGPYPADKLNYRSSEVVEYETPAGSDGLGVRSRLVRNDSPIRGVAMLVGAETSLLRLSMRLPATMSGLEDTILQQTELEASHLASAD